MEAKECFEVIEQAIFDGNIPTNNPEILKEMLYFIVGYNNACAGETVEISDTIQRMVKTLSVTNKF